MKNSLLTIFLFLCCGMAFCQNTADEKIIGIWKVKRVIHASDNANFKDVVNGFAVATFIFEKDHTFKITTNKNSKLFKMITDMANGKQWIKLNDSEIAVGSKKDGYSIMSIICKSENVFVFPETDLELEVEKQQ
ncbi:hypothetical protein [Flavobacterium phycosphaerae]|uniref:hypothetical protein n=1 Tax=Flavobacterium phycosphaerae TaxID=2697515 RepID=UPI00138ADEA1|nr:hypothetical protein [Flavobacterium phycosphaerae]